MTQVTHVSSGEIIKEVRALLLQKIDRKEPMDCRYITLELLGDHEGDEFMQAAAYRGLRNMVRTEVNRLAGDDDTTEGSQLTLPGYEHAHSYYNVVRGGREIAIPVETMSPREFDAKIELYEKFSVANAQHADELRRLKAAVHAGRPESARQA